MTLRSLEDIFGNTFVQLWCVESNGDPDYGWYMTTQVINPFTFPNFDIDKWYTYMCHTVSYIQFKMEELGVETDKMIWRFGYNRPLPLNPKHFDQRKWN